jgi:hypothetical protein
MGKAVRSQGSGAVVVPIIGYELRSPANLHELSSKEFAECVKPYPGLNIDAAWDTIQSYGRPENPEDILYTIERGRETEDSEDNAASKEGDKDSTTPYANDINNRRYGNSGCQQSIQSESNPTSCPIVITLDEEVNNAACTNLDQNERPEVMKDQVQPLPHGKNVVI